ncbi:hypothetical protein WJX72_006476 [[Myrmecia] bisecta]|uniref:DNA-directed RNA polymerase III subunit RPC5 n=1 Tax=[Myrmecia] bisecta TaxID=41462 RepID=A0AAW1QFF5_9CHLO
MVEIEPEDRVVRELDIYSCNGQLGDSTQLYLFQYPLRPQWRPYDVEKCDKVRVKPVARRVQMEVPLDTTGPNYAPPANPAAAIQHLTLTSRNVDVSTSYAVGTVRGDRLLLASLDEAMQMRPSLAHLDVAREEERAKQKDKGPAEPEDERPPELQALTVQVKRRETERQAEARLNSYAYISQRAEEERWTELQSWPANSGSADGMWEQLMTPTEQVLDASLSRTDYLTALVPASAAQDEPEEDSRQQTGIPRQPFGQPAAKADAAAGADRQQGGAIAPEALAALPAALLVLFRQYSVCNLQNIRDFLTKYKEAGAAKAATDAPDSVLKEAVEGIEGFMRIRRSYMMTKIGNAQVDPFRSMLLAMLEEQETLRKSDILDTAKHKGISVTDSLYTKVVKDLCTSRGNMWSLKMTI